MTKPPGRTRSLLVAMVMSALSIGGTLAMLPRQPDNGHAVILADAPRPFTRVALS